MDTELDTLEDRVRVELFKILESYSDTKIVPETHLKREAGIDQIDFCEILFDCEDEFDIDFDDEYFVSYFETAKDILDYVILKIKERE